MANTKTVPQSIIAEAVAQERAASAKKNLDYEKKQREVADTYRKLPKLDVQVSPMYAPYFGRTMVVMINGITVAIPCDGKRYKVPANYAAEVQRRIETIDAKLLREKELANKAIFEHSPGDIDIFQS